MPTGKVSMTQEDIAPRIGDDGLTLELQVEGCHRLIPLGRLVPGAHLLQHPTTMLTAVRRRHDGLELVLADGARFIAPASTVDMPTSGTGWEGEEPLEPDLLVSNIGLLITMDEDPSTDGPALGEIPAAAVAVRAGRVLALGTEAAVRAGVRITPRTRILDAAGRLVSPGLVDPHTHPAFAGDRAGELAMRARGASYQEIAGMGGGIRSTVTATRAAPDSALLEATARNLSMLLSHGVTTVEAKSGYALTVEGELRTLAVLRRLDLALPVDLSPTLLGAHVVAPEYSEHREDYVSLVCEEMVPRTARQGLAESVDVYCDQGAFTLEESREILEAARRHGLATRIHAGQFVDLGGAGLAAELGSVSADHLEAISPEDMAAMAAAGTVAVILPGAALTLACPWPPVSALREAGVRIALGTDLNPGTSMTANLPLMMSLGCMQLGMTVEETWRAVTRVAAQVALRPEAGVLRPGAPADLVIWRCSHWAAVPYHLGANLVSTVIKAGLVAVQRS